VNARDAVILKLQEDLDHMEHKYTVTLEDSNDRQEKINSQKDKIQKLEAESRQLQIKLNKQTEEVIFILCCDTSIREVNLHEFMVSNFYYDN